MPWDQQTRLRWGHWSEERLAIPKLRELLPAIQLAYPTATADIVRAAIGQDLHEATDLMAGPIAIGVRISPPHEFTKKRDYSTEYPTKIQFRAEPSELEKIWKGRPDIFMYAFARVRQADGDHPSWQGSLSAELNFGYLMDCAILRANEGYMRDHPNNPDNLDPDLFQPMRDSTGITMDFRDFPQKFVIAKFGCHPPLPQDLTDLQRGFQEILAWLQGARNSVAALRPPAS
jgi:hypothetical protein